MILQDYTFVEETRDADDEADADILISAIRHDLGDAEKSDEGEGERIEGENKPKKTDESVLETVAGGGDTSSQPHTNIPNHNLHPLSCSVTTDGLLQHNSHKPHRQILTLSHDMPLMPTCHTISNTSCHCNIQLWQLAV